jgi:hypothetical protein
MGIIIAGEAIDGAEGAVEGRGDGVDVDVDVEEVGSHAVIQATCM